MRRLGDVKPGDTPQTRELARLVISKVAVDPEMSNNAYLLRCADDSLYCGWTVDLPKRLAARYALMAPLIDWLCGAVDLDFSPVAVIPEGYSWPGMPISSCIR